jgi:flavin-dependent dehydrogenase
MADPVDVVIAGGGPAGLATAVAARLKGLEVTVLDGARPPLDKACGEGLMPDGAAVLESLGVDLRGVDSHPFRGIRYIDDQLSAEGEFPDAPGLGVRRTELHGTLRSRAETLGVDLRWGVRVRGIIADGFETDHGPVRGRWLVGADGRASRVRRWSGLDGRPARRRRFGVRRHFELEPWSDLVEVHWANGREAYVTPVGKSLVGVALLWSGKAATFDELLASFPRIQRRLENAPVASKDRGAGPLQQRCQTVISGNLALVGDASGYLDAITGEGLALSFRQAVALIDAIAAGDLGQYVVAHRRIVRYPNAITRLLLLVERHPQLRRRVMRSLAADTSLMSRFLALKMRVSGPRVLGADGLLPLTAAALRGGG